MMRYNIAMMIQQFIILYIISIPVFFLLDMLWLGYIARDFYQAKLESFLGDVNWGIAILFYLVYLVGLTYFAIYPAVTKESWLVAIVLGGLFGFFTYATYDLTNLSTLKDWPVWLSVVDILWGTILGAMVSGVAYAIYTYLVL